MNHHKRCTLLIRSSGKAFRKKIFCEIAEGTNRSKVGTMWEEYIDQNDSSQIYIVGKKAYERIVRVSPRFIDLNPEKLLKAIQEHIDGQS